MTASLAHQLAATREGGMVQRCHVIPHQGSYNNAEHTFGILQILRIFAPKWILDLDLYDAVLNHDVPERWTGDVPAPTKWWSPIIKSELAGMEAEIEEHFALVPNLSAEQQKWLKAADLLELWLWAVEQTNMGNKRCQRVVSNINFFISTAASDFLPKPLRTFWATYEWEVLPENFREVPHHVETIEVPDDWVAF